MSEMVRALMTPLDKYLSQKDVKEIEANEENYVCLQREGVKDREKLYDIDLTYAFWSRMCNVLANVYDESLEDTRQPEISAILPGGHRIEAEIGCSISKKIAVSIRVRRNIKRTFKDFGISDKDAKTLMALIKKGCNLMISGGTGLGKTTLLNLLIQPLGEKRILTIEDAMEIILPNEDFSVQFFVSRNAENLRDQFRKKINRMVRMNPDIIIIGEISADNAYPALRLFNTGHKGSFCTIHANTPYDAIYEAFPKNVQIAGYDPAGVGKSVERLVDVVIQLYEHDGKRSAEIYYPPKPDDNKKIRLVK